MPARKKAGRPRGSVRGTNAPTPRGQKTRLRARAASQAQEALRESESRLNHAQQLANLGSWDWNIDTGELHWSAQVYRQVGEEPASLRPTYEEFRRRIHPEDAAGVEAAIAKALAEKSGFVCEFRIIRPSGEVRTLSSRAEVVLGANGKPGRLAGVCLDITDRHRAEEKLHEIEKRSRLLWETMSHGVVHQDAGGTIVAMNPAAEQILGKPRSEFLGSNSVREEHDTVREDGSSFPGAEHPAMVALRTGKPVRGVVMGVFNPQRKARRWIRIDAVPVFSGGGERPAEVYTIFEDITERKQAQQALRESEEQFRAMFSIASVGKAQADPVSGRFLRVNAALCRITGYSEPELLARSFFEITHPDDRERDRAKLRRLASGEVSSFESEKRFVRPDGQIVWASVSVSLIHDAAGRPLRTTAVIQDITGRKRAEAALRESEERFRALANIIPNLAWWANGDGYITWYNQRWYEYTGTTPEQMQGWGWQSVHDPLILAEVLERWRASIATGEPFEMEFPLRRADGQFRWFLTRVMPVRGEGGKVIRWFGTNTDVSEAREAREVLRRGKGELERLVAERTARLQELVSELEHFSYTITHDMRAPLRAMIGYGEVVRELCAECGKAEPKEFIRRIMASAERMDALIRDALNYSRSVRQELPLEDLDTGALLRGMLDSYPELQPSKAHIRIEGPLPVVLGNEAGLTQCFSNLLGNAVKFVKPGETPQIRVWAEQREGRARIWVEDKGIGIANKLLSRVFDMFSRGSNKYEGTGIGLALVRKVMQRMGGAVGVESEEGKGSRFWLELRLGERRGQAGALGAPS